MEAQGIKNGSASIFKWKRKHFSAPVQAFVKRPCKCFSAAWQQPQVPPPRPSVAYPGSRAFGRVQRGSACAAFTLKTDWNICQNSDL